MDAESADETSGQLAVTLAKLHLSMVGEAVAHLPYATQMAFARCAVDDVAALTVRPVADAPPPPPEPSPETEPEEPAGPMLTPVLPSQMPLLRQRARHKAFDEIAAKHRLAPEQLLALPPETLQQYAKEARPDTSPLPHELVEWAKEWAASKTPEPAKAE